MPTTIWAATGKRRLRGFLVGAALLGNALSPSAAAHEGQGVGHSFEHLSPALRAGLFDQGLFNDPDALPVPLGQARAAPAAGPGASTADGKPLRVYVVVVDGLRPQEVGALTPTLESLRDDGTWYEQARTVFPGETLPAHAAMMTGVLPQRNGIIANQFYRGDEPKEYMQYPSFLDADTLTTRLERGYAGAISTATVLSKQYLYGLFLGEHDGPGNELPQRQADFHWDPRSAAALYVPNPSDHALDAATTRAFLDWIAQDHPLPHFAFVNLGDVDRAGHADESGALFAGEADEPIPDQLTAADVSPFRQAALEDSDAQIGLLVDELKKSGAWDETVLIVLSDHGMDWGLQHQYAQTRSALSAAGYLSNQYQLDSADYAAVGGGGSELIYVRHAGEVERMARIVAAVKGVEFIATRESIPGLDNPTFAELGIDHPRAPEIEAFMAPGYHSSPAESDNPLPGNHGNSITQHSALMVTGGHPLLADAAERVAGERVFDPDRETLFVDPAGGPGVVSIAPTVAALFGIGEPEGGYDADPLTEAFDPGALDAPRPSKQRKPKDQPKGSGGKSAPEPPPADPAPLLTVGVDVVRASLTDATYSLLVANRGSEVARGVVLKNTVPQNTTFAASSQPPLPPAAGATACDAGAPATTSCDWAIGDLAPGASRTIEVTYQLIARAGEYTVANGVSATGVDAGPTASSADSSLSRASHVLEDAHVDETQPGQNYGACDQLLVGADRRVRALLDDDAVGTNWGGTFGGWQEGRVETLWAAEIVAQAAAAPAGAAVPIGLHAVRNSWQEGTGPCAGAAGQGRAARASSESDPQGEPQAEPAAVATANVNGVGPVGWDVAEALDTEDERVRFAGFELRAADGALPAGELIALHSSEAADVGQRPRLEAVVTRTEGAGCIDADVETASAGADREQRITAYITDIGGQRVSNGGEDGCNGYPVEGTGIGWEIDDDAPDAYISSLAGAATRREVGSSGDAAPNLGSTRTDASGASFIGVRLGDPIADIAADAENRIGAIALKRYRDGKTAPQQGYPNEGTCEPGDTTSHGLFWCEGILGIPGTVGQPIPGEAPGEDDVVRGWR